MVLDGDGFLINFVAGVLALVEEVTGRKHVPADVTQFDFARSLYLSTPEEREVRRLISTRRGFCAGLPAYPYARQGVRRLRGLGDIICATTPWEGNPWWIEERSSWLAMHVGIDQVHFGSKTELEADLFVDDQSALVGLWKHRHPQGEAVFWRTPHNTSESVPVGAHSTSSMDALYEIAREAALSVRPLAEAAR